MKFSNQGVLSEFPADPGYSGFREWLKVLVFAVVVVIPVRWLVLEAFNIPSSSMEQTLLTGDYVFVSKLHYGARTPRTPLRLPLTHQKIFGIPAYLDWIQLPQYRLPGFSHVKRGDNVVFNYPMELERPLDVRTYYIKRCVGQPGDVLRIDDAQVYINDVPQKQCPTLQFCYYVETVRTLPASFFDRYAIREHLPMEEGYLVYTTPDTAEQLAGLASIQMVKRVIVPKGFADPQVYPGSVDFPWNIDQFGPITVPAKGMTIPINARTLGQYKDVIMHHEGHERVRVANSQLWIDGEQLVTYTFQQDYYFMMGDNRRNSRDTRFWGFVPYDHVVGKAVLIFCSLDPKKSFFNKKMRWNRFFKRIV